jgi:uncharacterized protein YggE
MKALDDAKAKAQAIADKEGLELGEPAFISEVSGSNTYRTELMMAPAPAVDMGTSISPGETAITVYMQVAYDIN